MRCFIQEVKEQTGHRILLLMDNTPWHFKACERNNIRIVFFAPNCTSLKQPCAYGNNRSFKKNDTNICISRMSLTSTNSMTRRKIERKIRGEDCAEELQKFYTEIQCTFSMLQVMWKMLGILLPKRLLKMLLSRHIVKMLLTVHIWLWFFIFWGGYHNFPILVFEYLILVLKSRMEILIEKSWSFHSCLYNCIGHWKSTTLTTNRA